jgi:rubrerythrin
MEGSSTSTQEFTMSTRLDFATLTLVDALDLAVLIEVEAHNRYRKFVTSMAENEAKHGRALEERRKAMFGDTPVRVSLDDLFDVEAPEEGAPRANMSALRAFEIALSSEQKAFDFYNEALPHVTDPEIHALFTELRDEETAATRGRLDSDTS